MASPPSDCPLTAMCRLSMRPENGPVGAPLASSIWVISKLMSAGWLMRSDSFGPPGALALPSGKIGAAAT